MIEWADTITNRMIKRMVLLIGLLLLSVNLSAQSYSHLEQNFAQPPNSARPWVLGFALGGNHSEEGITADLEAMERVGIGGVLFMETDQGAPKGPIPFAGQRWREMFQHLVAEANRLGLKVNMHNAAGWTGSGGPWITPELSMQRVVWTETKITGPQRFDGVLPQPQAVRDFYRDIAVYAYPTPEVNYLIPRIGGKSGGPATRIEISPRVSFPSLPARAVVPRDDIVNLAAKLSEENRLVWDVPEGEWTLLRMGYTTTGQENYPAPLPGRGLESDKLSKEATEIHFNALLSKLISDNESLTGEQRTLVSAHIDSWEVGAQNWTPKFREEFQRLRGYDPLPLLPIMSGRVIDSLEVSERFLWDVRQTISDLLADNYTGHFNTLTRRHGMRLSHEAYDKMPASDLVVAGRVDEPMGEFWTLEKFRKSFSVFEMASAAHVYGKPIVGAEAFTANRNEKWQYHPGNIKDIGDWAFSEGANRFVIHRYAFQPWTKPDRAPGMGMGPWGLHYERTQTWWEQSRGWHEYLTRCQYLLQKGLFVADLCFLVPENSPQRSKSPLKSGRGPILPGGHIRPGYNFDACPPEVVISRMTVENGRLVLPDGMSYRMLVLPMVNTMTPQLLGKIRDLVWAGATVLGWPPVKSPSLEGYPQCDEKVQALARELWGEGEASAEFTERTFGQGRVIWGSELQQPDPIYEPTTSFGLAKWIWFMEDNPVVSAPPGKRYFRRYINVDGTSPIATAQMAIAADNAFELWINNLRVGGGSSRTLRVAEWLQPGVNLIAVVVDNKSDTPSSAGFVAALSIRFGDGHEQEVRTDGTWEASDITPMNWPTEATIGSYWSPALELGPMGMAPWGKIDEEAEAIDTIPNINLPIGVLKRMGVPPDFHATVPLRHIHKRIGETDVYFVANPDPYEVETFCTFRVNGKQPEFWWPETGRIEPVAVFETNDVGTRVPLRLDASGSVFVIFRQTAREPQPMAGGKNWLDFETVRELTGPWELSFPPNWGVPERVTLDKLISWSEHDDPGVKYFSGTAAYGKRFEWNPKSLDSTQKSRVFLDLGKVRIMAQVLLNGRDLGTLWKPPYRVEVTHALKSGDNTLEIKVVNLWINRLIGDEQLPEDSERKLDGTLEEWPQWLTEGKPSPSGRFTFSTHLLWKKDDPLVESGLMGPVYLRTVASTSSGIKKNPTR